MEIPGARLGTRRTQLRVPSVEDPYVLLAIQYMIIICLHGVAVGGAMLSISMSICCLWLGPLISGALASFIYATSLGFYKSPSRLLLRVALLGLLSILGLLHIGPSQVY